MNIIHPLSIIKKRAILFATTILYILVGNSNFAYPFDDISEYECIILTTSSNSRDGWEVNHYPSGSEPVRYARLGIDPLTGRAQGYDSEARQGPVDAYSTTSFCKFHSYGYNIISQQWEPDTVCTSFWHNGFWVDGDWSILNGNYGVYSVSDVIARYPNGCDDVYPPPTDSCPDDPSKMEPGACGCGVPDTDTDGDGTPNCNDGCPEDPTTKDLVKCIAQQNLGDPCQ